MAVFRLAAFFRTPLYAFYMSSDEFLYWQAFFELEPPDKGDNERTAAILAQITNMAGRSLPDNKRVSPKDFLPDSQSRPTRQSMEDQIAFMKSLTVKPNG